MDAEPPQRLQIDIVRDGGDWTAFADVEAAVQIAARTLSQRAEFRVCGASACIALSSAATIQQLNRDFRGHDRPTNVLSFPARQDALVPTDGQRHLGDVVLAAEIIAAEAAQSGVPPIHHCQHLVVHGLLHLLGFEHDSDQDAERMERLEADILRRIGIADPYLGA